MHAIIDNFSRRILAWKIAEKLSPLTTCELLREAPQYLGADDTTPELYADSGIEHVNALVNEALIHRVLAQVEVAYSNSMTEAWWRSLRSDWLHLNTLDTAVAVRRLTSFYATGHNTTIPHSASRGETPDEMYFGTDTGVAANLTERRAHARQDCLVANRALTCRDCRATATAPAPTGPLPRSAGESL